MLRKNITILVLFVLLSVLLSFSVAAQAQAYATSSYAFAYATGDGSIKIDASATILNLISSDGGVQQGYITYAEASGYASNLVNLQLHPVLSSRAGSSDGYWSPSDYWSN